MSDMQKWDMKSFKISDYKAFSDEKDIMVTSYVVTIEGTYDGKDASGTFNSGTVWKQEKRQLAGHLSHQREAGSAREVGSRAESTKDMTVINPSPCVGEVVSFPL